MADIDAFRTRFPEITVGLNWSRFSAEGWPIACVRLTEASRLHALFSFMRISFGRINSRKFLHGISRNLRVGEVLARLDKVPSVDRESILYFREAYRRETGVVHLQVPVYSLGKKGYFILDGNHRVCGLAAAMVPFEVEMYVVEGPISKSALRDVAYCR